MKATLCLWVSSQTLGSLQLQSLSQLHVSSRLTFILEGTVKQRVEKNPKKPGSHMLQLCKFESLGDKALDVNFEKTKGSMR